jgi:uncharacterized protein YciI
MNHFLVRLGKARPELMTRALVEAHVAWLRRSHAEGALVLCGSCPDGTALVVLRCATQEDAERVAHCDPFADAGAYAERSVVAFRLAAPHNNFLLDGAG